MMKSFIAIFLCLMAISPMVAGRATSIVLDSTQVYIDHNNPLYSSVQGGDTLYLSAGHRQYLLLMNFRGLPGNPIVVINKGGQVIIDTDHYYGVSIRNCRYIKFTGTGTTGINYGFKISRVANGGGVSFGELSSDFELDHVSIENTLLGGLYAKTDPGCGTNSTREFFTQYNTVIHDNYIAHTGDEGMYIGSTSYSGQTVSCNGRDTLLLPSVLEGVKIYNNIVEYSGWDGIQVSSASKDCKIYNNTVLYDSQDNLETQMSGIILGGGTKADCYNNFVAHGNGDGIECHGLDGCRIFNNIIVDAGLNYLPGDLLKMKFGIYLSEDHNEYYVQHNDIIHPKSDGIRANGYLGPKSLISANVIINPGNFDFYQNGLYTDKGIDSYIMIEDPTSQMTIRNNYLARDASLAGFLSPNLLTPMDFDISQGSPLIDAVDADPVTDILFDYTYDLRPHGLKSDIGAFEYYGASGSPNPTAGGTIASDQSICKGGIPAAFTNTTDASGYSGTLEYKWQTSITGLVGSFTDIPASNSATYLPGALNAATWFKRVARVTSMIDWTGAAESNTVKVTVNPLPAATAGANRAVCLNTGTQIGVAPVAGSSYSWVSSPVGMTSAVANPLVTPQVTTTYTLSETVSATGCTSSNSVVVTVNPLPAAPAAIAGAKPVCVGSTITLTDATAGGVWSSSTTSVATVTSGGVVTGLSAGTDTIRYSITNANGCVAQSIVIVTVAALPTVFSVTGGGAYCTGGTGVAVGITGSQTGVNYQLKLNGTNTGTAITGTGAAINFGLKTAAGTYTVAAANATTTCSDAMTGSAVVTVSALTTPAAIGGTKSVCTGSTTILTDATTGGVWSSISPLIATVNATGTVTGVAPGTATILYTYTNAAGCSSSVSATVTVNALPAAPAAIGGTKSVCAGSTTQLTDATTGGTWSSTSTAIATVSTKGVVTGISAGSATIIYTVKNTAGCTSSVSAVVTVNPAATQPGNFTTSSASVKLGQTNVAYTVPPVSGVTYKWSYSGKGATITGTTNSVLVTFSLTATSGTLSVTASNSCGTSSARSIAISALKGAFVPEATTIAASETPIELVTLPVLKNDLRVYPNPSNGVATFEFEVSEDTKATLKVFSISGQLRSILFNASVTAGTTHTVLMDRSLTPGLYPCVLIWNGKMITVKLLVQ